MMEGIAEAWILPQEVWSKYACEIKGCFCLEMTSTSYYDCFFARPSWQDLVDLVQGGGNSFALWNLYST